MPRVGSRQASLNKLIWCTLLCYLLCSGDKICNFREKKNSLVIKEKIPHYEESLNFKSLYIVSMMIETKVVIG